MKIFSNIDQAFLELDEIGKVFGNQNLRVGTGEIVDSLSLDELTLYSVELIRFFNKYPKWKLELKTKSSRVNQFLEEPHAGNIIVSFSVNPQNIIESEEHGTASLLARLEAAKMARQKNFLIAFHIDPMIYHPNWRDSYASLVAEIVSRFSPEDIPIMSVGALRFQPEQRHMMRERFGLSSLVTQAEMFPGADGKLRYDHALRSEMFEFVTRQFKSHSENWKLFLCMETPETWARALGQMPKSVNGLGEYFDSRLTKPIEKLSAATHKRADSLGLSPARQTT